MAPRSEEPEQDAGDERIKEEEESTERQSKRRKKMKMGEESGLTDAQRRQLRREQRELAKKLHEGPEEEDEQFLDNAREMNNELFENVRFTREAVLDAENVDTIAAKFVNKADSMISAPRFEPMKFVGKLKSKLMARDAEGDNEFFDWYTLGVEAGVCFNSIPSRVSFLAGPLENVDAPEKRKARAPRQKKVQIEEDEIEETKPEQMQKQKKNVDQLSQAERDLKKMRQTLEKRTKETREKNLSKYNEIKNSQPEVEPPARLDLEQRGDEVDIVPFLVNPKSFTQTVENIFNFSFLVKKGEAKIKMRKPEPLGDSQGSSNPLGLATGGCFVSPPADDYEGPAKQCVLSFSMKDWRNLCEAYELDACDIPHRKGSKQKAFNSQQLSQQDDEEE